MTKRGRDGVSCSDDILKERGGGRLKNCVFTCICTSAVITVFNVNHFVFIECYLLCFIGQSFDFNFYILNFYVLMVNFLFICRYLSCVYIVMLSSVHEQKNAYL